MDNICLGAYATLQEAEEALGTRKEPSNELQIMQDGDSEHSYRIWWTRSN